MYDKIENKKGGLLFLKSGITSFVFKTLVIIIVLLLVLSIINFLSLVYSIRPSVVMSFFIFGGIVSNIALTISDKFIFRKEDPLPEYVLKKVDVNEKEIQIIKKVMEEEYGITPEEVKVRAKAQRNAKKNNGVEEREDKEGY